MLFKAITLTFVHSPNLLKNWLYFGHQEEEYEIKSTALGLSVEGSLLREQLYRGPQQGKISVSEIKTVSER
jgi:hypothetical protein